MGREFDNKIKYFFGPSKDLGLICCPKIKEKNEAQRCKKMQEFKTRWHALNQIW